MIIQQVVDERLLPALLGYPYLFFKVSLIQEMRLITESYLYACKRVRLPTGEGFC